MGRQQQQRQRRRQEQDATAEGATKAATATAAALASNKSNQQQQQPAAAATAAPKSSHPLSQLCTETCDLGCLLHRLDRSVAPMHLPQPCSAGQPSEGTPVTPVLLPPCAEGAARSIPDKAPQSVPQHSPWSWPQRRIGPSPPPTAKPSCLCLQLARGRWGQIRLNPCTCQFPRQVRYASNRVRRRYMMHRKHRKRAHDVLAKHNRSPDGSGTMPLAHTP